MRHGQVVSGPNSVAWLRVRRPDQPRPAHCRTPRKSAQVDLTDDDVKACRLLRATAESSVALGPRASVATDQCNAYQDGQHACRQPDSKAFTE